MKCAERKASTADHAFRNYLINYLKKQFAVMNDVQQFKNLAYGNVSSEFEANSSKHKKLKA